ncbi:hypothetical protein BD311DRAFT_218202 [Dichomitus squalens]|uniref:Uncharacterized protein n=1 Tax=Dichomitus squalens TaxID=114155 RepID=A0A4Q9MRQ7_9APHY|nr:hypothetical protein BD311DRAFT_218202 [Dichomitus squalens]
MYSSPVLCPIASFFPHLDFSPWVTMRLSYVPSSVLIEYHTWLTHLCFPPSIYHNRASACIVLCLVFFGHQYSLTCHFAIPTIDDSCTSSSPQPPRSSLALSPTPSEPSSLLRHDHPFTSFMRTMLPSSLPLPS